MLLKQIQASSKTGRFYYFTALPRSCQLLFSFHSLEEGEWGLVPPFYVYKFLTVICWNNMGKRQSLEKLWMETIFGFACILSSGLCSFVTNRSGSENSTYFICLIRFHKFSTPEKLRAKQVMFCLGPHSQICTVNSMLGT